MKKFFSKVTHKKTKKAVHPTPVEVIEATHQTLNTYAQTFRDLARYDRRERVKS